MARPPKPTAHRKGYKWVWRNGAWREVKREGGKPQRPGRGGEREKGAGGPGKRVGGERVRSDIRGEVTLESGRTVKPLGTNVGADSAATVHTPYGDVRVRPQYYQGDEWNPATFDPDRARWNQEELKVALKELGYGSTKSYKPTPGMGWREADAKAMRNLMVEANVRGLKWEDVLDEHFSEAQSGVDFGGSKGGGGGGGGGGGAAVAPTLDPEEVRQAVDTIAQQTIGSNADPALREQITAEVVKAAQAADQADVMKYDVESEIRRKLREKAPGTTAVHDVENTMGSFFSMLGEGGVFAQAQQPEVATGVGGP